jgi:alkylglycerol monooxygenase
VFGTRSPVRSFNPLRAITPVYVTLARDAWHTQRWQDKLRVLFMPPDWRPDDVAQRFPQPPFDPHSDPYDPPATFAARAAAVVLFLVSAVGCGRLPWDAESMDMTSRILWTALLMTGLCGVGWLLESPAGAAAKRNDRRAIQ